MPTGYTHCITEGATFEEFAWKCARGMVALTMMRDEPNDAPIPERFEPSDWHAKKLAETKAELATLLAMPDVEVAAHAEAAHIADIDAWSRREHERHAQKAAYEAILARVDGLAVPPSHSGYKEFMRKQVAESIDFDTSHVWEKPQAVTGEEWKRARVERLQADVVFCEKMHAQEVKRTRERNEWLATLRKIIPPPQPKSSSR